jgi:hypothetical protein
VLKKSNLTPRDCHEYISETKTVRKYCGETILKVFPLADVGIIMIELSC